MLVPPAVRVGAVSDEDEAVNDDTMKFGLLMESAQVQQKLIDENLAALKAHTRDLDGVVRDEIRRTLIEELQALTAEGQRAASALRAMGRVAGLRMAIWSLSLSALCTVIPGALLWLSMPSEQQLSALRAQRDVLTASVSRLQAAGGRIEWRHCGEAQRLCVRIDRGTPGYGDKADFLIVKGY